MTEAGGPLQEAHRKGAAMVACSAVDAGVLSSSATHTHIMEKKLH